MTNVNYLRIPMHMLIYDVPDVDSFKGLPPENVDLLFTDYSAEDVQNIIAALQFAADNPNFDFSALNPELKRSNAEIHSFLCKVHDSVQMALEARTRSSR
jgi:hypothetical protein